jgi:hypothetical protein
LYLFPEACLCNTLHSLIKLITTVTSWLLAGTAVK